MDEHTWRLSVTSEWCIPFFSGASIRAWRETEIDHLIGSVLMRAEMALLVLGLVGGSDVLRLVRGGGGGGGRGVGDGGALAAQVAGEEDEGDGATKDGGDEGQRKRGLK